MDLLSRLLVLDELSQIFKQIRIIDHARNRHCQTNLVW